MALRKTAMRGLVLQTWVDSSVTSAIHTASCAGSKSSKADACSSSWSPSTITSLRKGVSVTGGSGAAGGTAAIRAIAHRLPILGPGLAPGHGATAGLARLAWKVGLVAGVDAFESGVAAR